MSQMAPIVSRVAFIFAVALTFADAGPAYAQPYPNRPIELVVPFGPGGRPTSPPASWRKSFSRRSGRAP
jgi:hypothetical protein